jgi:hypothetical protein
MHTLWEQIVKFLFYYSIQRYLFANEATRYPRYALITPSSRVRPDLPTLLLIRDALATWKSAIPNDLSITSYFTSDCDNYRISTLAITLAASGQS